MSVVRFDGSHFTEVVRICTIRVGKWGLLAVNLWITGLFPWIIGHGLGMDSFLPRWDSV
jgi:hypothetical protein